MVPYCELKYLQEETYVITGSRIPQLMEKSAYSIRVVTDKEIRQMGRVSRGVRGIKFSAGDKLIGMEVSDPNATVLTVTVKGYGKRSDVSKYRLQKRAGYGTINLRITDKNGPVVGVLQVTNEDEVMVITQAGKAIRMPANGISKIGRATQGVRLINMSAGDRVVSVARLGEKE